MKKFLVMIILAMSQFVLAQQFVEHQEEVVVDSPDESSAKREAQKVIIENVTLKAAREILGSTRFEQVKNSITRKILPNYVRYIPLLRPQTPSKTERGYKINFQVRLSTEDLKSLLSKEGLLLAPEESAAVLPLISFSDFSRSQSYRWWLQGSSNEKDLLRSQAYLLLSKLREEYTQSGLYLINTVSWSHGSFLPEAAKKESFSNEDLLVLSRLYKANLVLKGSWIIESITQNATMAKLTFRANLVDPLSGRSLSHFLQSWDLPQNVFLNSSHEKLKSVVDEISAEVSSQAGELFKKGIIGSKSVKISVRNRLSFADFEKWKSEFQRTYKSVKGLRDRRFEEGLTILEADVAGGAKLLAESVSTVPIEGFMTKVLDLSENEVSFSVQVQR
jgi:hypothetical protein